VYLKAKKKNNCGKSKKVIKAFVIFAIQRLQILLRYDTLFVQIAIFVF